MNKKIIAQKQIELNKRDYEIFKLLNAYGCIKKRTLSDLFSEDNIEYKNRSIRKRLYKLCEFGYLKSVGWSYMLSNLGKETLENAGIEILYSKDLRERNSLSLYKASDVILKLKFEFKQSRIEFIKSEKAKGRKIENIKSYCGVVWNDPLEKYIVYKAEKIFNHNNIARIKSDLNNSIIENIILVIENIAQLKKYKKQISELNAQKFLVIINNEKGYELLNLYMKNKLNDQEIINYISSVSEKSTPRINQNMLETFNTPTINLMILDIVKEVKNSSLATLRRFENLNFIFEKSYAEYFEEDEKITPIFKGNTTNISIDISKYKTVLKIE